MNKFFVLFCILFIVNIGNAQYIKTTIFLPDSFPRILAMNLAYDKLYVACEDADSVFVIEAASNQIVNKIPKRGFDIEYNNYVNKLYCACGDHIAVVDGLSDSVIYTIPMQYIRHYSLFCNQEERVYCRKSYDDDTIHVIDCIDDTIINSIVFNHSFQYTYNSVNKKSYFTYDSPPWWNNSIMIIDAVGDTILDSLNLGEPILALCYQSNRNWILCATIDYGICCIDGETDSILGYMGPSDPIFCIEHNVFENKTYCACFDSGNSYIWSCDWDSSAQTQIPVDGNWFSGLMWDSVYNRIYCADSVNNNIFVIDCRTDSLLVTLNNGLYPCTFAQSIQQGDVYIANYYSSSITVIGPETGIMEYAPEEGVFDGLPVVPNPFTRQTNINMSKNLFAEGTELKIYNACGRLVKSFGLTPDAPRATLIWDGTDDQGQQLPSGVYFVRCNTEEQSIVKKVLRIR